MRLEAACVAIAALIAVPTSPLSAQPAVTFTKDIAPIIFEHCSPCHRPGEIGPFSLITYDDVRPRARAIAVATRARTMPPWKPEPGYGDFIGARRLEPSEIDLIQQWVDQGTVEGAPRDLPPAPAFPDGWRLGRPDLVVSLAEPYTLPAGGPDILRNFVVHVPVQKTRYVSAIEFRSGNASVVHHANIRVDRTHAAQRLDEADPRPGFDGKLTTGEFPDGHFLGWTPGQLPPRLQPGMAWRLEPMSDLVVQLHMHPRETQQVVQPSIAFFFTDQPPERTPMMLRLGRQNIDIAPGSATYVIEDSYVLPVDVEVFAVQPHAHFRAKEIKAFATLPGGANQWLLYIKDWDFNWQDAYRYISPIALPKGTTLRMQYRYDNSAANRRNPDRPPKRVRWGQNSTDEMGDLWVQVVTRSNEDRRILFADFGPKALAEDAAGYETQLAGDPLNAQLHEAVAALYLVLDRRDEAIAHLRESLRIDRDSVEAHYNLATALVWEGRADEAMEHFRRALQIDPNHVAAHVNLGAVLRSQNRFDEATIELNRALQLDPPNAAAHTNLAGVLATKGNSRDAVAHYRLALDANGDLLEPLTALAWILATAPAGSLADTAEAVRLAERAARLTNYQDVRALNPLAAAYDAAGRKDDAARVRGEIERLMRKP